MFGCRRGAVELFTHDAVNIAETTIDPYFAIAKITAGEWPDGTVVTIVCKDNVPEMPGGVTVVLAPAEGVAMASHSLVVGAA